MDVGAVSVRGGCVTHRRSNALAARVQQFLLLMRAPGEVRDALIELASRAGQWEEYARTANEFWKRERDEYVAANATYKHQERDLRFVREQADALRGALEQADVPLGRIASSEPLSAQDYRQLGMEARRIVRAVLEKECACR